MPRDLPDWGALSAQQTVHEITDLGELAVRLGSIVQFDRRGDVIFMEDFEDGTLNKWQVSKSPASSSVTLSRLRARSGEFSALLTAYGATSSRAGITHYLPYPVLSAFGLEASISRDIILDFVDFIIDLYDGVNVTSYALRWEFAGNVLSYKNAGGTYTPIGTVYLSTETSIFHSFKLVVDGINNEYVRAIVNNQAFSLKEISAQVGTSGILPVLFLQIELGGGADVDSEIWVDDVIATHNEPPEP